MKKIVWILAVALLLSACTSKVVCDPPYLRHAAGCCLDSNKNNICDTDEVESLQELKDLAERAEVNKILAEKLTNDNASNVYEAVQQSFKKNCYIWKRSEGWNVTNDDLVWDNFMNARCSVIQDCIDFYKSIGASEQEIKEVLQKGELICAEKPPY
jgi:hypothetical protein